MKRVKNIGLLLYATKIIIINYNNYEMGIDGWVGGVA